jgi:hypothetical protein
MLPISVVAKPRTLSKNTPPEKYIDQVRKARSRSKKPIEKYGRNRLWSLRLYGSTVPRPSQTEQINPIGLSE